MKLFLSLAVLSVSLGGLINANAVNQEWETEIQVDAVLAPERGYDDNDFVQVVLQGFLPSGCFVLGRYELEPMPAGYRIRQFAVESKEGACSSTHALPHYLNLPVPYTTEITIGQLNAGTYALDYQLRSGQIETRSVEVVRAATVQIDSQPYAAVTNAIVDDIVSEETDVQVTVTGTINSSCTELDTVRVERLRDSFVLLPLLKLRGDAFCVPVRRLFSRTISLGRFPEGHTLIHVRSTSGRAINRVVEMVPSLLRDK